MKKLDQEYLKKLDQEYLELMHAMQTGVKMDQELGSNDGTPKHLRVGVNSALVSGAALVKVLIDKGVITELEYKQALVDYTRAEVESYRHRVAGRMGVEVERVKLA